MYGDIFFRAFARVVALFVPILVEKAGKEKATGGFVHCFAVLQIEAEQCGGVFAVDIASHVALEKPKLAASHAGPNDFEILQLKVGIKAGAMLAQ